MFTKNRSNKRIGDKKRTSSTERRSPRKNRFKKNSRIKSPNRKIKLGPFLHIFMGLFIVIMTSLGMIFVHDLFTQTHYFSINNIDLTGVKYLSKKDLHKQSGVAKGDNLLSTNLDLIRKRLMVNPWIENVRVSRNFPDGLQIHIAEYQPEAIVKIENELYLMNKSGIIFKTVSKSDPKDLPFITGLNYTDIPISHLPASAQFETVRKVLLLGRDATSLIPINKIRQIIIDSDIGITLEVFDPSIFIQIGYDHYPQKYNNLRRILKYINKQKNQVRVSAIDLSDLDQIVVTPVNLESPHQG